VKEVIYIATIVNNPSDSSSNGMGFLLGIIVLVVFFFVLLYYGIPYITAMTRGGGPSVQIPNKLDVNVHNGK